MGGRSSPLPSRESRSHVVPQWEQWEIMLVLPTLLNHLCPHL